MFIKNVTSFYQFSTCYKSHYVLYQGYLPLSSLMFRRKSLAVLVTGSLFACKNNYAAHYPKNIKDINAKLGILNQYGQVMLSCMFGVMPLRYQKNYCP